MHQQQQQNRKLFPENEEDDDSDDVLDFSIKKRKIDDGQRQEVTNGHSLRPSRSSPSLLQDHRLALSAELDDIKRPLTGVSESDKGFGSGTAGAGLGVENSALLKHLNGNALNGHFAALKPFNDDAKFGLAPLNMPMPISYRMPVNPATKDPTKMPNHLAAQSLLTSPPLQQSTPNQHHHPSLLSDQLISQYYQYLLGAQALASLRQKSVVFENGVINNGNGGGHFVSGTPDLHSRLVKDCRSSSMDLPHNNTSSLHVNNNGVPSDSNSVFNLVMRRKNSRTPLSNGGQANNVSTTTKHDSVLNGDSATVSPPQVTSTSHPHIDSPSTPPASSSGASPLSSGGMSTGTHDTSALHHRASMMTMSSDDSSSLHRARCSTSPTTSDSGGDVASSRGVRNVGGGGAAMSVRRRGSRPTSTTTTTNNGTTTGAAPLTMGDEARRMSSISPGSVHSGSGGTNTSSGATRRRGKSLPDALKDEAYWERRRKNNEAAKRSRDLRRAKEDEVAVKAALLEQENARLRLEVAALKAETERLRQLLLNT